MRKIDKGIEPLSLIAFKQGSPNARYSDLSDVERRDIRAACTTEQFYLCAYCCQLISGDNSDTMNEHVEAQAIAPNRSLDFTNIVASCRKPNQCDAAHGSRPLTLTPLMQECETELRFRMSGRVEGLTERAENSIQVLNLGDTEKNNKALIEMRKQLIDSLIWEKYGDDPANLELEDDKELLNLLIDDLLTPEEGKLAPFAPVLVNILRKRMAD
ncbi:TIGR02646 family protein [Allopseudospirillum japonicum]|uniref:TIGR02646 family protein n=1 Tax=Allopseudospirillum japonicum TaxID=64971 RepID=A0A1H6SWS8_9GAMM|nr:TIGR02646 family protein [Allopseudospirillum japonicum]SEI71346.1 TIGR02646 family protein [Allopseudospirillum japonicum]